MAWFHKIEVQMVILMWLTSLNLFGSKVMIQISFPFFLNQKRFLRFLCHYFLTTCQAPQNDRLNLSFVKEIDVVGKKMAKNGCKTVNTEWSCCMTTLWFDEFFEKWKMAIVDCLPKYNGCFKTIFGHHAAWPLCDLTSFLICKDGGLTTIAKKCPFLSLETFISNVWKLKIWIFECFRVENMIFLVDIRFFVKNRQNGQILISGHIQVLYQWLSKSVWLCG